MPRFLVSLAAGVVELFRLGPPRPVTLRDGTDATAEDLTPVDLVQPIAGTSLDDTPSGTQLPHQ